MVAADAHSLATVGPLVRVRLKGLGFKGLGSGVRVRARVRVRVNVNVNVRVKLALIPNSHPLTLTLTPSQVGELRGEPLLEHIRRSLSRRLAHTSHGGGGGGGGVEGVEGVKGGGGGVEEGGGGGVDARWHTTTAVVMPAMSHVHPQGLVAFLHPLVAGGRKEYQLWVRPLHPNPP